MSERSGVTFDFFDVCGVVRWETRSAQRDFSTSRLSTKIVPFGCLRFDRVCTVYVRKRRDWEDEVRVCVEEKRFALGEIEMINKEFSVS